MTECGQPVRQTPGHCSLRQDGLDVASLVDFPIDRMDGMLP
jgi:hypothetical protein